MNLTTIQNVFTGRHDFDDDDVLVLKLNWTNISFINIPTSWIVAIDNMLIELNTKSIFEIRQDFGQFIIKHNGLTENNKKIIKLAEEEIYNLDTDLRVFSFGVNNGFIN